MVKKLSTASISTSNLNPALPVTTDVLLADNKSLEKARVEAIDGDKASGYALKKAEKKWIKDFRDVVNYISYTANGNAVLITSTNLKTTKDTKQKRQPFKEIKGFKAGIGNGKGTFCASCANPGEARGFLVIGAPKDADVQTVGDSIVIEMGGKKIYLQLDAKKKVQIGGATSSEPLLVYMQAFNTAGSSPLTGGKEVTPQ